MSAAAAALQRNLLLGASPFGQQTSLTEQGSRQQWNAHMCRCQAGGPLKDVMHYSLQNKLQPSRRPGFAVVRATESTAETKQQAPPLQSEKEAEAKAPEAAKEPEKPKKPTLKKGLVVRVDRELYYKSVEALATNHPPNYKGIDYIFEDRGEILDVRIFEAGEYALVAWSGILTAPAWLPAYMLHTVEKNAYKRIYGP